MEETQIVDVSSEDIESPQIEAPDTINDEIVVPTPPILPPPPEESVDDWILDFHLESYEDFWFEAPDR